MRARLQSFFYFIATLPTGQWWIVAIAVVVMASSAARDVAELFGVGDSRLLWIVGLAASLAVGFPLWYSRYKREKLEK